MFAVADYITLHVPATPTTKNMICADTIAQMKDGVKIINLARAELVNGADIAAAMESGKVGAYVVDFPTEETVAIPGVVTIPHLGASTEESEDNCAVMAADELNEYLATGNIRNSVNYPNASMPKSGAMRICVLHANVPAVITNVANACAKRGINIDNMLNQSKGENAYTMLDISTVTGDDILADLSAIGGVRRARLIKF